MLFQSLLSILDHYFDLKFGCLSFLLGWQCYTQQCKKFHPENEREWKLQSVKINQAGQHENYKSFLFRLTQVHVILPPLCCLTQLINTLPHNRNSVTNCSSCIQANQLCSIQMLHWLPQLVPQLLTQAPTQAGKKHSQNHIHPWFQLHIRLVCNSCNYENILPKVYK